MSGDTDIMEFVRDVWLNYLDGVHACGGPLPAVTGAGGSTMMTEHSGENSRWAAERGDA